jgi:hypothetical protein
VSGGACATSCTSANAATNCDTAAGYGCLNGTCQKSPKGSTCTNNNQCSTNHCVSNGNGTSNVCCAVGCTDSPPCGTKALCLADGSACQTYPAACAVATCTTTGPPGVSAGTCSGPSCVQNTTLCNAGYACSDGACASSCSGASTGCATGYTCVGTICLKLKLDGQPCSGSGECAHGTCIGDGVGTNMVCCATPCPADFACGNKALCAVNGSACQTHAGESCGSPSCSDQRSSLPGKCDGSRVCTPTACTTGYLCVAGACTAPGGCTSNSDCDGTNSYVCSSTGSCVLPLPVD